jgi:hypothetical protein
MIVMVEHSMNRVLMYKVAEVMMLDGMRNIAPMLSIRVCLMKYIRRNSKAKRYLEMQSNLS